MNYFEFYNLPIQFHPDLNLVKSKFYHFSKQYHPDFFATETTEKQQEMLELSTLNNKAYQILSNPAKRLKYVLELKGIVQADEGYQLSQSFLMEMMDVNEILMDMQFEPDASKLVSLRADVDVIELKLFDELKRLTELYDKSSGDENTLGEIKDLFYRQKYVNRIREQLPKN